MSHLLDTTMCHKGCHLACQFVTLHTTGHEKVRPNCRMLTPYVANVSYKAAHLSVNWTDIQLIHSLHLTKGGYCKSRPPTLLSVMDTRSYAKLW